MRTLTAAVGLECYALVLAALQWANGVRTDEAKYLLDIPYPHPPLVRWFLSLFDGFAWQEQAARVLFATVMVQATWLVWDMGSALKPGARLALCVTWLGSAAFVFQAGTVMMAVLTALQALVFLRWLSRPREALPGIPTIAFFWLLTLFTALQGLLLVPLVVAVLRRRNASWAAVAWYVGAPAVLLSLYALGNPFTLASFVLQGGKDAGDTVFVRALGTGWVLILAGSGIVTVAGIVGMLREHSWSVLASFALFCAYVFLGRFDYYAIFFLPFLVAGVEVLFRRLPLVGVPAGLLTVAATVVLGFAFHPFFVTNPARDISARFDAIGVTGLVLIAGDFGHEWQYGAGTAREVRPYVESLHKETNAIVCTNYCVDLDPAEWTQMDSFPVKAWTRAF